TMEPRHVFLQSRSGGRHHGSAGCRHALSCATLRTKRCSTHFCTARATKGHWTTSKGGRNAAERNKAAMQLQSFSFSGGTRRAVGTTVLSMPFTCVGVAGHPWTKLAWLGNRAMRPAQFVCSVQGKLHRKIRCQCQRPLKINLIAIHALRHTPCQDTDGKRILPERIRRQGHAVAAERSQLPIDRFVAYMQGHVVNRGVFKGIQTEIERKTIQGFQYACIGLERSVFSQTL